MNIPNTLVSIVVCCSVVLSVTSCSLVKSLAREDENAPEVVESNLDLRSVNKNAPPFDSRKRRKQLIRGSSRR